MPDLIHFSKFAPSWDLIEPLRRFIEAFAEPWIGASVAAVAAMAASELLENATKYGNLAVPVELELRYNSEAGALVVRVTNSSQPARIRILQREFARVTGEGAGALKQAMERLARLPQGTSMLGLARLAGEGELTMDIDGDRVAISAKLYRGIGGRIERRRVETARR